MPRAKYVVVSASSDGHLPFVEQYLDEPFVVIDPGKVMQGVPLSFRFNGQGFEPFYENRPLKGVVSVWYRKPELALPAQGPEREGREDFIRHTLLLFMRQFCGLLSDALWVSNYYAILRASDKLRQLMVAHNLGFKIPETLVTSNAAEAEMFAKSHNATIAKPIEVKIFVLNGQKRMMLARRMDKQNPDFSGLHLAPAIIQEAVEFAQDIRVTVVGSKVFAATVTPKIPQWLPTTMRDWRAGDHIGTGTDIRPFELPAVVARRCVRHVKEMGLKYGAIDLLLDKEGTFWFLENNPNGQWAFVEEATGQPIGRAMADLLMSGHAAR